MAKNTCTECSKSTEANAAEYRNIASIIASVLITIAAISMAVIGLSENVAFLHLSFGALGVFAVLGAALLIDFTMDSIGAKPLERVTVLNGGYLLFSLIIAGTILPLLILTDTPNIEQEEITELFQPYKIVLYIFSVVIVWLKLMIDEEPRWFPAAFMSFFALLTSVAVAIIEVPFDSYAEIAMVIAAIYILSWIVRHLAFWVLQHLEEHEEKCGTRPCGSQD